jgi:hypothetical protein
VLIWLQVVVAVTVEATAAVTVAVVQVVSVVVVQAALLDVMKADVAAECADHERGEVALVVQRGAQKVVLKEE